MRKLSIKTAARTHFVDITDEIAAAIADMGVKDGVVTVFVPHTTAGITINENADPSVTRDMARALDDMVPWDGKWQHAEGNAAAHVKATLCGSSAQLIVSGGRLALGVWQAVYLAEFDGPRSRQVWVK